jgi:hypothetical protein
MVQKYPHWKGRNNPKEGGRKKHFGHHIYAFFEGKEAITLKNR